MVIFEFKGLCYFFYCIMVLKKDNGLGIEEIEVQFVCYVGMLGAGLMGVGVVIVLVDKGVMVCLKDRDMVGVFRVLSYVRKYFLKVVK